MKKFLSILILFSSIAFAGGPEIRSIIAPGLKMGYAFGKGGGFIYGFDVSVICLIKNSDFHYGNSISIDFSDSYTRIHIGVQGYYFVLVGADLGPTLAIDKEKNVSFGTSFSIFAGLALYPYFNYTGIDNKKIYEVGGLVKIPFLFNTKKGLKIIGDL